MTDAHIKRCTSHRPSCIFVACVPNMFYRPGSSSQFKHTDQQLEVAVTASRDAVSRALANMPALLTAGPKSRPSTPEIAPASTGAWSSRARRPAPTSSVTSTSGPIYAGWHCGGWAPRDHNSTQPFLQAVL